MTCLACSSYDRVSTDWGQTAFVRWMCHCYITCISEGLYQLLPSGAECDWHDIQGGFEPSTQHLLSSHLVADAGVSPAWENPYVISTHRDTRRSCRYPMAQHTYALRFMKNHTCYEMLLVWRIRWIDAWGSRRGQGNTDEKLLVTGSLSATIAP